MCGGPGQSSKKDDVGGSGEDRQLGEGEKGTERGREGGKEGRGEEEEEEIDLSNTEVTYQIGKNYGDG